MNFIERITGLITNPDKTMEDVAKEPRIEEAVVVIAIYAILSAISAYVMSSHITYIYTDSKYAGHERPDVHRHHHRRADHAVHHLGDHRRCALPVLHGVRRRRKIHQRAHGRRPLRLRQDIRYRHQHRAADNGPARHGGDQQQQPVQQHRCHDGFLSEIRSSCSAAW